MLCAGQASARSSVWATCGWVDTVDWAMYWPDPVCLVGCGWRAVPVDPVQFSFPAAISALLMAPNFGTVFGASTGVESVYLILYISCAAQSFVGPHGRKNIDTENCGIRTNYAATK